MKQKLLLRINHWLELNLPFLYISLGFCLFGLGIFVFVIGFHNFDSAQNYDELELWFNNKLLTFDVDKTVDLKETFMDGEVVELNDVYRLGVKQLFVGLMIILIGIHLFSYNIDILEFKTKYRS